MANYGVKVRLEYDRMGNLLINPVNKRLLARCKREIVARHKADNPEMHTGWQKDRTVAWLMRDACIFVQREDDKASVLASLGMANQDEADNHGRLSDNLKGLRRQGRTNRQSLESGWPVLTYMGHEYFESLFCCHNGIDY